MRYFIGIVPPAEYVEKVAQFQRRWVNLEGINIAEPHITVKAQGGLTEDEQWLPAVEKVCANFQPFHVTLGQPAFFGKAVMYLSVDSDGIDRLHRQLMEAIPSGESVDSYFEGEAYCPHLTLGQTSWGISEVGLKEIAEEAALALQPYPAFTVDFLRIYRKADGQGYVKMVDIPFKSESER